MNHMCCLVRKRTSPALPAMLKLSSNLDLGNISTLPGRRSRLHALALAMVAVVSGGTASVSWAANCMPVSLGQCDISSGSRLPVQSGMSAAIAQITPMINAQAVTLNYWDANGSHTGGGSGTWSTVSPVWTDATGLTMGAMQPQPGFGIFGGNLPVRSIVTIDNSAGAVSATGMQFVSNGYVLTGDTLTLVGASGSAPVVRVDGAGVTATTENVLTGTSGLNKTGTGLLVLTGANTYSGNTILSGGTLLVTSDANLGAPGSALDFEGGTLRIDGGAYHQTARPIHWGDAGGGFNIQSDSDAPEAGFIVSQSLSGTGSLSMDGTGTLTLSGANTYSGGTFILGGRIVGDTTSLQGAFSVTGKLQFNQQADGIFSGVISGNGYIEKTGLGALVLNGAQAFSGLTEISAGELLVGDSSHPGSSLGGTVIANQGGTIGGVGTIGTVGVNGTLAPGDRNSMGTLHVAGDATFGSGTFLVKVAPDGTSDSLAVDGLLNQLGNVVVLARNGQWSPSTSFTIVTYGGLYSGNVNSLTTNLAFLTPVLNFGEHAAVLTLTRNDLDFAKVAQTRNQRSAADAIDHLGFANTVYGAILGLDAAAARSAFDQLSGEQYASTRTALINDDRHVRDAINRHLLGLNNNGASSVDEDGGTAWTSAWGHWGDTDGDGNASRLQANGSGLLIGADTPVVGDARIGVVIGHRQDSLRIDGRGSNAHVTATDFGFYADKSFGAFALRGGVAYAWQDVDGTRNVEIGSFNNVLGNYYRANTLQGFVEGGYCFEVTPGQQLEPFVNLSSLRLQTDSARESGGAAALVVAGRDSVVTTAMLGVRDRWSLSASGGMHAHASLAWQRAWGDLVPVAAVRFADSSDQFDVAGVPVAKHAAVVETGLLFDIARHVSVDASYTGQFASRTKDQGARLSLNVQW